MRVFSVIDKATSKEVYRYNADAPIEFSGMEFSTHEHRDVTPAPEYLSEDASDWRISIGPFFDRFGDLKIPILASTDPIVQAIVKNATVRKYIALVEKRAEILQALQILQLKGFPLDTHAILDVKPTGDEIYRG